MTKILARGIYEVDSLEKLKDLNDLSKSLCGLNINLGGVLPNSCQKLTISTIVEIDDDPDGSFIVPQEYIPANVLEVLKPLNLRWVGGYDFLAK